MRYCGVNLLRFVVASLLLAGLAHAQNIRVNVPFQFAVGDSLLPAGSYNIKPIELVSGDKRSLAISNSDGRVLTSLNTNAVLPKLNSRIETKLVFQCYGDTCLLSQVWSDLDDVGRQVPLSHKMLKQLAEQWPHEPAFRVVAALH